MDVLIKTNFIHYRRLGVITNRKEGPGFGAYFSMCDNYCDKYNRDCWSVRCDNICQNDRSCRVKSMKRRVT